MSNVLPVILRELAAEARRPQNRWLRLAGAAGVFAMFLLAFEQSRDGSPAELGIALFLQAHRFTLIVIWLLVPLLLADTIARERREGTLELLYLTPLNTSSIILGKTGASLVRALCIWWASVPMQVVPFLFGGVSVTDAIGAVSMQFCTLLLAVSAGIQASVRSSKWNRALLVTYLISGLHALLAALLMLGGCIGMLAWYLPHELTEIPISYLYFATVMLYAPFMGTWDQIVYSAPVNLKLGCLLILVAQLFLALGTFALSVWDAGRWLKSERGRAQAESPRWQQKMTRPVVAKRFLARRRRRLMDANPIAWLQMQSWNQRISQWGWCVLVIVAALVSIGWSTMLDSDWRAADFLRWTLTGLTLALTFTAVASFRQEKENGVLELILISPLKPSKLLHGRVLGLWQQFMPALLVYCGWFLMSSFLAGKWTDPLCWVCVLMIGFVSVPLVGFYFSLRSGRLVLGWALTWLCGIGLPLLFGSMLSDVIVPDRPWWPATDGVSDLAVALRSLIFGACFIATGMLAAFLLKHCLERRLYSWR